MGKTLKHTYFSTYFVCIFRHKRDRYWDFDPIERTNVSYVVEV